MASLERSVGRLRNSMLLKSNFVVMLELHKIMVSLSGHANGLSDSEKQGIS
jgi:hypothetical protein